MSYQMQTREDSMTCLEQKERLNKDLHSISIPSFGPVVETVHFTIMLTLISMICSMTSLITRLVTSFRIAIINSSNIMEVGVA